ncbi:MAG: alpha/beta hydrolase [Pseudomonadales bacterium]|nr:alpha/beta hydrolase [Pseudomonadales bacterium]
MKGEVFSLDIPGLHIEGLRWRLGPRPILALHGWMDNAASFCRLAPLLQGYDIYAIDLAGHGHSGWRAADVRYHLIDYAYDVSQVLHALGWSQCVLLGHSMGAAVASLLAAAQPDRVAQLILLEGLGPLTSSPERSLQHLQDAFSVANQPIAKVSSLVDWNTVSLRRQQTMGGVTQQAAECLLQRSLEQVAGGCRWRSDRRIALSSSQRFTEEQVLNILSGIVASVLLIVAIEGLLLKLPTLTKRQQSIPNLQRYDLPGSHHLHLELSSVQAVADTILAYAGG